MKKIVVLIIMLSILSIFTGCSSKKPNDSPDMVVKTFATIVCDVLNGKKPNLEVYNGLWQNKSLARRTMEEIAMPGSHLIVPLQNRGEITYLLGKNESIQKNDKYLRFIGITNKNSKNIYGCFALAIIKVNDKYYIANGGYVTEPAVKNRDFYKEP